MTEVGPVSNRKRKEQRRKPASIEDIMVTGMPLSLQRSISYEFSWVKNLTRMLADTTQAQVAVMVT